MVADIIKELDKMPIGRIHEVIEEALNNAYEEGYKKGVDVHIASLGEENLDVSAHTKFCIQQAMERAKGVKKAAAKLCGMNDRTFHRKYNKYFKSV